jgi:hypothetical protein
MLFQPSPKHIFQRFADLLVEANATGDEDLLVKRLPEKGMGEAKGYATYDLALPHYRSLGCLFEGAVELLLRKSSDSLQDIQAELPVRQGKPGQGG